jgi:hypothetical protein
LDLAVDSAFWFITGEIDVEKIIINEINFKSSSQTTPLVWVGRQGGFVEGGQACQVLTSQAFWSNHLSRFYFK